MKKLLLTAAAFGALALPATAADMPVYKAPIPVPVICIWCGWYAGVNAGYSWSQDPSVNSGGSVISNPGPGGFTPVIAPLGVRGLTTPIPGGSGNGFIGGAQIGYNYQSANFVVGVESDIQGLSGRSSGTTTTSISEVPFFPGNFVKTTLAATNSINWLGTLRGRAGFTITPSLLVYGTGGLAYGEAESSTSIGQGQVGPSTVGANGAYGSFASISQTRAGWTAGAGAEWLFAQRWSAKVEYLHYDLGSESYGSTLINRATAAAPIPAGTPLYTLGATSSTRFSGDIVRAGINYKFW